MKIMHKMIDISLSDKLVINPRLNLLDAGHKRMMLSNLLEEYINYNICSTGWKGKNYYRKRQKYLKKEKRRGKKLKNYINQ